MGCASSSAWKRTREVNVAEEAAVEEQVETPKPAGKGSSIGRMLLIVVLALVSSAGGGVLSWVLISRTMRVQAAGQEGQAGEKKAEEQNLAEVLEKSAVVPLEPFVVNLADSEAARYLRIKVSLMIDDKSKLAAVTENQALQLKVRDVILSSLTNKTSHELINEDGKNKLRHEIQQKVAVYFREPKLVDVMFTEFVIQL
jgi:flagellar protein FliL